MKIVIVTAGSLGDTAPYVGLGARLKAAGHDVAVAAQRTFETTIVEAGLEFREMPGDVRALLASDDGQRMHRARSLMEALPPTLRFAQTLLSEVTSGIVEASRGAELLILHRLVLLQGRVVAHALGIPCLALELFPSGLVPTSEFLPATLRATSLGEFGNRAVYGLLRALAEGRRQDRLLQELEERLALPRTSPAHWYRRMRAERWPVYHAFSSFVVPRPKDWPEHAKIVGYLWPRIAPRFRAPDRLVDFLKSGARPVFVGLGSLVPEQSERLARLVVAALRRAKVRAVLQGGWGDYVHAGSDDVLCIGDVPHTWLFPQVAAVVHAAGAGVTAASLRASVPSVCIPAMNDQFFWAERLRRLGVSPGFIRFQDLSAPTLALLLRGALADPSYSRAARRASEALRTEDGAGRIVEVVAEIAERARAA
ncbi:MAG TPA: glycosyltransferase [Polyangiaceae bacterium]|nr:glycosyltransferase [Polyangiaceae bacterium]